uniref:Uncharacterized protein n=1 Tax=Poecilia latipinna TaxID=48699 RepID=A0A3B3UWN9_9TELE
MSREHIHQTLTVKHSIHGSIILWACFSSKIPDDLDGEPGTMNWLKYQEILRRKKENLVASARKQARNDQRSLS